MSSSDRPGSGSKWSSGFISIAITLLSGGAVIYARFYALEEAKQIMVGQLASHESRIGELERNNALLERIHKLEVANTELIGELKSLRQEVEALHQKRR